MTVVCCCCCYCCCYCCSSLLRFGGRGLRTHCDAVFSFKKGDFPNAIEQYAEAIRRDPKNKSLCVS